MTAGHKAQISIWSWLAAATNTPIGAYLSCERHKDWHPELPSSEYLDLERIVQAHLAEAVAARANR